MIVFFTFSLIFTHAPARSFVGAVLFKAAPRILRQAVAAVAKRWIVVVRAYARVEADAVEDFARVEPLHLGIRVELIEVRDTKCQIRIREQLDRLGLRKAHEKRVNVFLFRPLMQELSKTMRHRIELRILRVRANDNAAWIEIVVERMPLTQEFRTEEHLVRLQLRADVLRIADRTRRLDDHIRIRIAAHHQTDDRLNRRRVKEILLATIIRRRRNDDQIRIAIHRLAIRRHPQPERLLRQELLNVLIPDWRLPLIDQLHLLRLNIHSHHIIVLRQQHRQRKTDIAGYQLLRFSSKIPPTHHEKFHEQHSNE